jgi:hypothetical protein
MATDTDPTIELLDTSFSMLSMLYEMNVGDKFFPELLSIYGLFNYTIGSSDYVESIWKGAAVESVRDNFPGYACSIPLKASIRIFIYPSLEYQSQALLF